MTGRAHSCIGVLIPKTSRQSRGNWYYGEVTGEINFLLGELRHHRIRQSPKPPYAEINNLNSAA